MGSPHHARAFRMECPKCGNGTTYSVTQMLGTYGERNDWACRVFSCTCGKRLYGTSIKEEYDRQRRTFDQVEKETRKMKEAARAEARAVAEAKAKVEAEAEASRQEEEERKRLLHQSESCAWGSCEKKARETSLYCSRDCSNKNARWRYKQRLKGQKAL